VTFALSNLNLRLGTPTAGLQIGPGGTIGIASISAPAPRPRRSRLRQPSWTAVVGANLAVSLSLPGVSGSVTGASLKINRAAGAFSPATGTPVNATRARLGDDRRNRADGGSRRGGRLDGADPRWSIRSGAADAEPDAGDVARRADRGGGHLEQPQPVRLHHRGANFALSSQSVDVDLDGDGNALHGEQLENATLLTIALSSLTLSVGISGVGLTLSGGSIGIAVLSAPVPTTGRTRALDGRCRPTDVAVALDLPGITAVVSDVALRIGARRVLKNGIVAAPVNWANLGGTTNGSSTSIRPAVHQRLGPGRPGRGPADPGDLAIKQRGDSLAISGSLSTLNVFDFITGSAHFAITRQAVDVDVDGDGNAATGEQLNDAGLLTIALDQLNVTIGGAGGLSVTSGQLGIAILNAPVAAGDTRSWTAVTGKDIGVSLSVPGMTATVVGGAVVVNRASGGEGRHARDRGRLGQGDLTTNGLVDFNAAGGYTTGSALVDPGANLNPAVAMPIAIRGKKLAVGGQLTSLNLFGLITGSADFALQTSVVDVDFDGAGGSTDAAG
jgi:hypothetical protein